MGAIGTFASKTWLTASRLRLKPKRFLRKRPYRFEGSVLRFKEIWGNEQGYTLLELLTVIGIVGVLTALMVFNANNGQKRQQLRDGAHGYVTAVRYAESLAASSQSVAGASRKAYGVCITIKGSDSCVKPGSGQSTAYYVYARPDPLPAVLGYPTGLPASYVVRKYNFPVNSAVTDVGVFPVVDFLPPGDKMQVHNDSASVTNTLSFHLCQTAGGTFCQTINLNGPAGSAWVD